MLRRRFGIGVAVLLLAVGLLALPHLPAEVASHWDAAGHVNGTLPRLVLVLLGPLLTLAIWLLALVLPRIDPRARGEAAFGPAYWLIMDVVLAFLGFTFLLTISAGLHRGLDMARIVPVSLGLLFLILGSVLGRVPPNWFVGIRTPWTLSDETVWRETHRAGGWAFMIAGALIAILSLVMPVATFVPVLIGTLVPAAGLTLYSYLLWRRRHGGAPGAAGGRA